VLKLSLEDFANDSLVISFLIACRKNSLTASFEKQFLSGIVWDKLNAVDLC